MCVCVLEKYFSSWNEAIKVNGNVDKIFSDLPDCLRLALQMDNQIVVSDYAQMDRVLREERAYILNMVKQIKKAGCNVLLIQKSILRLAVPQPPPLARHII